MSQLRQSPLTKEWVIMAAERGKPPDQMRIKKERTAPKAYESTCPFCPGNEQMTPAELQRVSAPGGQGWQLRVVPNKYPVLSLEALPNRVIRRTHRSIDGAGAQEVIIETPNHSLTTALLSEDQVLTILRSYRDCFIRLSEDSRIAQVTIFKNHGPIAGASLQHPHSQVIAGPVVSSQLRATYQAALNHWDEFGECVFCAILKDELDGEKRIVVWGDAFVAFEPFASVRPFVTHIFPRRHHASFGDIRDEELKDLARVLHSILRKIYVGLNDPDFNYTIVTAPAEASGSKYYHWYLSIVPRIAEVSAGLELGSGTLINTVLPEVAAEFLRNIEAEKEFRLPLESNPV